jgi:predicted Zn-dependent protease
LINRPSVIIKPLLEPSQLLQLALKNSKDMKIEGSEISVEMNAYNDVDILQFVSTFLDNFDDVIKITSFEIKKNKDVDDITLASIEKGEKPVIVTAKLTITWQTIKFDQPILDKKDQAVAKEKD